jgi:predicted Zn-dependent protease
MLATSSYRVDPLTQAVEHLNAGAGPAASACLAPLLRAEPGDPVVLTLMGLAMMASDRAAEAENCFRQAWSLSPGQPEIAVHLARTLRLNGRPGEAVAVCEAAAPQAPGDRDLLEELAAARAEDHARIEQDRAVDLQRRGRFAEAKVALRSAVASNPLDMEAHLQLNELIYRQGHDAEFLASYDEASALRPEASAPLVAKGRFLLKRGDAAQAYAYFDRALARSAADLGALLGQAQALEALARPDEAARGYARALAVAPDSTAVLIDNAGFLLRVGESDRATVLATRAAQAQPDSQEALALLTLCYRAIGDAREQDLADPDAVVGVFDLDAPAGFADMAAFNRELAAYLASRHGDVREHFTQTLRGGTRLYGGVFDHGHTLADRLRPLIDQAIVRYILAFDATTPAPLRDRRTDGFAYVSSWSSQLVGQGHHVNHIHPEGWISAVYYVATPEACDDETARQGWLKFGEPSAEFGLRFAPRRLVRPRPGRLVLFPSYLWHGTTPFASDQSRMTIAFDVAPSAAQRREVSMRR